MDNLRPMDKLAFPSQTITGAYTLGMTLREWYAGLAMQGLLANPNLGYEPGESKVVGRVSRMMADDLIAELAKEEKP